MSHEAVLEAMVEAWFDWREKNPADFHARMRAAIRAANERGFDLCKLPNKLGGPIAAPNGDGTHSYYFSDRNRGWNDCLNAVEVVRIDEGEGDERL